MMINAYKAVRKEGLCSLNDKGVPIRNPSTTLLREAMDQVYKHSQQFGFSPASRSRISAPKKDGGDELDDWQGELKVANG